MSDCSTFWTLAADGPLLRYLTNSWAILASVLFVFQPWASRSLTCNLDSSPCASPSTWPLRHSSAKQFKGNLAMYILSYAGSFLTKPVSPSFLACSAVKDLMQWVWCSRDISPNAFKLPEIHTLHLTMRLECNLTSPPKNKQASRIKSQSYAYAFSHSGFCSWEGSYSFHSSLELQFRIQRSWYCIKKYLLWSHSTPGVIRKVTW